MKNTSISCINTTKNTRKILNATLYYTVYAMYVDVLYAPTSKKKLSHFITYKLTINTGHCFNSNNLYQQMP